MLSFTGFSYDFLFFLLLIYIIAVISIHFGSLPFYLVDTIILILFSYLFSAIFDCTYIFIEIPHFYLSTIFFLIYLHMISYHCINFLCYFFLFCDSSLLCHFSSFIMLLFFSFVLRLFFFKFFLWILFSSVLY